MRKQRTVNWDAVIAICALFTAVISLWVGVRQTQIQERTLSASVWPVLEFYTSSVYPDGRPRFVMAIRDEGVGPALVRTMTIAFRGRRFATSAALLRGCCIPPGARAESVYSTIKGTVVAAHDDVQFLAVPGAVASKYAKGFAALQNGLVVQSCYCSVLDECWMLDSREERPLPVSKCPPADEPQYQG